VAGAQVAAVEHREHGPSTGQQETGEVDVPGDVIDAPLMPPGVEHDPQPGEHAVAEAGGHVQADVEQRLQPLAHVLEDRLQAVIAM
jgi:hypothetical protein